ncbi:uncharacterized protein LOC132042276 [Lycium ferocissimum]|uniref:uncharacterized protein LOC132042276 n=1 Tax=Lycium ferocissimum TaxID=112874 RepID=UPI002814E75B|nr:uncharacterized protein LOC132042276 [Lycium ferocissimum]
MSSLVAEIKEHQDEDPVLVHYRDTTPQKEKTPFVFTGDVLRYRGRLCVPNVAGLHQQVMGEAHYSHYSIHPGTTKMNHDLKEVYWWDDREAQFKANFWRSFQDAQVLGGLKVEQLKRKCFKESEVRAPEIRGTPQRMPIPEWKWEKIEMDFVVSLPKTLVTTRALTWPHLRLYMGGDVGLILGGFDVFEVRPWGTDLLRESLDKVKVIQEKLLAVQSRQNEYAESKGPSS